MLMRIRTPESNFDIWSSWVGAWACAEWWYSRNPMPYRQDLHTFRVWITTAGTNKFLKIQRIPPEPSGVPPLSDSYSLRLGHPNINPLLFQCFPLWENTPTLAHPFVFSSSIPAIPSGQEPLLDRSWEVLTGFKGSVVGGTKNKKHAAASNRSKTSAKNNMQHQH